MGIFDNLKKTIQDAVNQPSNETQTFTFQALPESVSEMQALPEASLDSPFKTAALTVCALCAYAADTDIGISMMNFLKGPQPLSPYEMSFIKDRFMDGKHVPFSYFKGATPANSYTPDVPYVVSVSSNPYSYANEGYCKLFIHSGGADNDREVVLRKKGDQWFLWEQFLLVGIRTPAAKDPWA